MIDVTKYLLNGWMSESVGLDEVNNHFTDIFWTPVRVKGQCTCNYENNKFDRSYTWQGTIYKDFEIPSSTFVYNSCALLSTPLCHTHKPNKTPQAVFLWCMMIPAPVSPKGLKMSCTLWIFSAGNSWARTRRAPDGGFCRGRAPFYPWL